MLDGVGAGTLSEAQSKALLTQYGLPMTREVLVRDTASAIEAASRMGGPVALKVQSPDIPHKTEAGAIALNVSGIPAIGAAHDAILASARRYKPDARIEGVLVQEMVTGGTEMLLGITSDSTFGPVLTVGFGGIHVEVLRDVAHRLPPIDADQAREALEELRLFPLLGGVRGAPAGDVDALVEAILRFSWLAHDLGDRIAEVDVNPLVVLPQGRGVRVVDALVVTS
jgi:acetyltransferase